MFNCAKRKVFFCQNVKDVVSLYIFAIINGVRTTLFVVYSVTEYYGILRSKSKTQTPNTTHCWLHTDGLTD